MLCFVFVFRVIPGVLSRVLTLELSNIMSLLDLKIVLIKLWVLFGFGSLVLGLYVGQRISSAADVLGQAQQICVSLICWAQPSCHF